VLRANFDGVSSEYVQPVEEAGSAKYEYGCNVTAVHCDQNNKEVLVTYQDRNKKEQTAHTARVFAADGPSSTIRGFLMSDVKRKYAGYVCDQINGLM
jgi:2-polyprenyl-6-methoxyphenol hydroxylase-like FAD-dependent oxidoreductase